MKIKEVLRHPRVSNIDIRYSEEDNAFLVYPYLWTEDYKRCSSGHSEFGDTLDEALNKIIIRLDLS